MVGYRQLLSSIFLKEFNRNSKFNSVYRSLFNYQFGKKGVFFDRKSAEKFALKFQFDAKNFDDLTLKKEGKCSTGHLTLSLVALNSHLSGPNTTWNSRR